MSLSARKHVNNGLYSFRWGVCVCVRACVRSTDLLMSWSDVCSPAALILRPICLIATEINSQNVWWVLFEINQQDEFELISPETLFTFKISNRRMLNIQQTQLWALPVSVDSFVLLQLFPSCEDQHILDVVFKSSSHPFVFIIIILMVCCNILYLCAEKLWIRVGIFKSPDGLNKFVFCLFVVVFLT